MIQGILILLMCGLIGFVFLKVAICFVVIAASIVGGAVRWVVVPAIMLVVGLVVGLVRGLGWTVAEVVTMPLKMARMTLTPDRRTRAIAAAKSLPAAMGAPCRNDACLCVNPAEAAFCRRCGRSIPSSVRYQNRHANRPAPAPARPAVDDDLPLVCTTPWGPRFESPRKRVHRSFRLTRA